VKWTGGGQDFLYLLYVNCHHYPVERGIRVPICT
jgi:hypothetical protein